MGNYWLNQKYEAVLVSIDGELILSAKAKEIIRTEGKIEFKFRATSDKWARFTKIIDGFCFVNPKGTFFKKRYCDVFVLNENIEVVNLNYTLNFPEDRCQNMDILEITELFYKEQCQ